MAQNIATPQSPRLRNIFSGGPWNVAQQISFDQTVELIHVTVDVVLDVADEVMDANSASLLRSDLERYGREVAFAAAAVYAKAAENRGRAGARRQAMLIEALVDDCEEQIATRASGLFPLGEHVRVLGMAPPPDTGPVVLADIAKIAERQEVVACAAQHGRFVLCVLPALATATVAELGTVSQSIRGPGSPSRGVGGAVVGGVVVSGVVESLVYAGAATAAVLSGLRALPAWQGPQGV
nr:hypothetical protein [Micromonospora sp. DSM 115978]